MVLPRSINMYYWLFIDFLKSLLFSFESKMQGLFDFNFLITFSVTRYFFFIKTCDILHIRLRPTLLLISNYFSKKKTCDMICSFDDCRKGIVGLVLMQINYMH